MVERESEGAALESLTAQGFTGSFVVTV